MNEDNDNKLKSIAHYLKEYLDNLKTQKDETNTKIQEIKRHLDRLGHSSVSKRSSKRKAKGENQATLEVWFAKHPDRTIGQTEIARETEITPSSARAALDKLTDGGILERHGTSWKLKQ